MGRLQRRLTRAGYHARSRGSLSSPLAEIVLPIVLGAGDRRLHGRGSRGASSRSWRRASATRCRASGWRARRRSRQKQIQNGLPDALDLLIVCVEAGAGLDAAIVKASEELAIAYPALAEELR